MTRHATRLVFITLLLLWRSPVLAQPSLPFALPQSLMQSLDTASATATRFQLQPSTPQAPLSQVLAPPDYKLGPGDGLLLTIFSQLYTSYQLTVTPEGKVIIPRIGEVLALGATLKELRERLVKTLAKVYRSADVSVSLLSLRSFDVELLGEVSAPTKVRVSAAERVSDAVMKSQTLLKSASYRRVQVKRRQPDTTVVADVFRYFRLAEQSGNPYLKDGDALFFLKRTDSVTITGEVIYPDVYEVLPNDSLYALIKLAGGVRETAYLDSIEIIRFNDDKLSSRSIYLNIKNFPPEKNIPVQRGDFIVIRRVPKIFPEETVTLTGEVRYPGVYRITPKQTRLRDVIALAGGFTDKASLEEASVIRPLTTQNFDPRLYASENPQDDDAQYAKARSRERKGKMSANFKDLFLFGKESENIFLEPGDAIDVPKFKNYVNVIGRVIEPGNVEYEKNLTVRDYIARAGGFGRRADEGKISVIKPNTGDVIEASKVTQLEPGDTILVPELPQRPWIETAFTFFRDGVTVIGAIATTIFVILSISRL